LVQGHEIKLTPYTFNCFVAGTGGENSPTTIFKKCRLRSIFCNYADGRAAVYNV